MGVGFYAPTLYCIPMLFKKPIPSLYAGSFGMQKNIAALYGRVMHATRQPLFYQFFALPDTPETRFELLVVHVFLVLRRLHSEKEAAAPLTQGLTEFMVSDLDRSLREAGIGDVGVAKRMKRFMEAFYGHCQAYETAWADADPKALLRALDRNLFAALPTDIEKLHAMRRYMLAQEKALASQSLKALQGGDLVWAEAALQS